ncbi:Coiled-coil-helix-coiled-coil-helix domain-containing protein 2, partial [Lemmus lemmus]
KTRSVKAEAIRPSGQPGPTDGGPTRAPAAQPSAAAAPSVVGLPAAPPWQPGLMAQTATTAASVAVVSTVRHTLGHAVTGVSVEVVMLCLQILTSLTRSLREPSCWASSLMGLALWRASRTRVTSSWARTSTRYFGSTGLQMA